MDTFFAGPNVFAAGKFGLFVSTNNGSSFGAGTLTGIGTSEKIAGFAGAARNGQIPALLPHDRCRYGGRCGRQQLSRSGGDDL